MKEENIISLIQRIIVWSIEQSFMIELIQGLDQLIKGEVGKTLVDGLIQSQENYNNPRTRRERTKHI